MVQGSRATLRIGVEMHVLASSRLVRPVAAETCTQPTSQRDRGLRRAHTAQFRRHMENAHWLQSRQLPARSSGHRRLVADGIP